MTHSFTSCALFCRKFQGASQELADAALDAEDSAAKSLTSELISEGGLYGEGT
jgi:hypothetical protein